MAVITLAGFTGYAFPGIGKFAAEYVDLGLDEQTSIRVCAIAIFAITTLYVLLGGLYSVVITNVIQTVVLTFASIVIAAVAYAHLSPELLAGASPTDGTSLTSLLPQWRLQHAADLPRDYAGYEWFGALVLLWVVKGLLLNLGGPGQMYDFQIFLSARHPRDAAKVGAAWSGFLVVRWAMCMGIALLAVTYGIDVVNQQGLTDAEAVMPKVLGMYLGPGVLGLVIAGLLAAFMSTFAATVNAGASYIVRDLWQPLVRPQASQRQLVRVGYAATLGIVVAGTLIGFYAQSIRQVWDWLMLALGAAFLLPNVLRWYWWRLNGWGYAAGTLAGLAGALPLLILSLMKIEPPLYVTFPALCAVSLVAALAGTLLTPPTDEAILVAFYRQVRPFGCWGPVRRKSGLSDDQLADPAESMTLAVVNVVLGSVVVLGVYLAPMYLVGHWHGRAALCLGMAAAAAVALYFTWYRNLPEPKP
jgi:Na+/proline symporter